MGKYEPLQDKAISEKLVQKAEILKQRPQKLSNAHFGMIAALGGVIIMPLGLAVWLGNYLDAVYPQRFSWTLSLLLAGFCWSMFNAYLWLKMENERIQKLSEISDKTKNINNRENNKNE